MKKKNFIQAEDAQAIVIGFVLIMGILVVASTSYFAAHIPDWTKAYESLHASVVTDDFSELKSLIEGIVLTAKQGGTVAAGTTPIKMAPDKVPILGMSPPGSNLNFLPHNEPFLVTPTVTGAPSPPSSVSDYLEESTTADFNDTTATRVKVDITSNEIKLSRLTTHGNLILDGHTTILGGEYYYDQVEIINSGTLYVVPGEFLKLYADNITVDSTFGIIADGRGHSGGDGGKIGGGMGYGNPGAYGAGGGGAGYGNESGLGGGDGGNSSDSCSSVGVGGADYGNRTASSIEFGSGGGGGGYGAGHFTGANGGDGGDGGGAILLHAEKITLTGTISADGSNGQSGTSTLNKQPAGGGGGGSGGTILIRGCDVAISGTLSAKGGSGGDGGESNNKAGGGGGGGAGGRIKVFYENASLYASPPTGYSCCVGGGTGGDGDEDHGGKDGKNGSLGSFYEKKTTYISSIPHYSAGYYVSRVYDTWNTTTCYGNMTWDAYTDEYTPIVMKVRTSRSSEMEGNATMWENCPAVANGSDISDLSSAFDGHRYIQYRAELNTYEATMTPVLKWVRINYSSSDPEGGSPTVEQSSGIIKFNSNYFYYPNQEIVYEHGAVIKSQGKDDGKMGFMLHPPRINITNESGIPALNISMVELTGTECSYSGSTTTAVENSYEDYNSFSSKFDNLTLNLSTAYPYIWEEWFNKELEKTTLNTPYDYNVSVNVTAKTVAVEFYGHEQGVQLYLEKTAVAVKI